jgi:8-oxo-dGTP pyrophosphatase MutT (NUDIX family)
VSNEQRRLPEISLQVKATWHSIRKEHSAGGVAYRWLATGEVEIALIATHGGARWQLPKGAVEPGETAEETAIREVEEEAGLQTCSQGFLKSIDYWYWDTYRKQTPDLVHKQVDFFLLMMIGGELSDSSYEVDSVGWFTPAEAIEILTFAGEKTVVQLAMEQLNTQ